MDWEKTDLTLGAIVIGAVALIAGALFWLAPMLTRSSFVLYADFPSVEGIDAQSRVLLRGFPVGQVDQITPLLSENGAVMFRVRMRIVRRLEPERTLQLPLGTRARLVPPQIPIGTGQIDLDLPTHARAYLPPGARVEGVVDVGAMAQVQAMAAGMSGDLNETMKSTRALVDSLRTTVAYLNQVMLAAGTATTSLTAGLQRELTAAEALTTGLHAQVSALGPRTQASLDSMAVLAGESRVLVSNLNSLATAAQPRVTGILSHLDCATGELQALTRRLSERPLSALFRGVQKPPVCVPAVTAQQ